MKKEDLCSLKSTELRECIKDEYATKISNGKNIDKKNRDEIKHNNIITQKNITEGSIPQNNIANKSTSENSITEHSFTENSNTGIYSNREHSFTENSHTENYSNRENSITENYSNQESSLIENNHKLCKTTENIIKENNHNACIKDNNNTENNVNDGNKIDNSIIHNNEPNEASSNGNVTATINFKNNNHIESVTYPYRINFLNFLVQPFFINIDEGTMSKIIDIFIDDEKHKFILQCCDCEKIQCICYLEKIETKKQLKIKTFHVNPIVFSLNFKRNENKRGFYTKLMKFLVENISDFNVAFNAELLTDIENPIESIVEIILYDYKAQIFRQMLKILASVDFLGNIGSLTDSFSIGVKDLFYEPYLGLKEDDPRKFTLGLLKGGSSLIKNTVSGVTGTISKLSSSLSKGVGLATFDKEFQSYSPIYQSLYILEKCISIKHKEDNNFDSSNPINSGLKRLGVSITSGFTGIFNKPVEGAKEGIKGFLKGVGKGTVGLVTKPIVGIADLAGGITEGIKKELDGNVIYRIQFPRVKGNENYETEKCICYFIYTKYLKLKDDFVDGCINDGIYIILTNTTIYLCKDKDQANLGLYEVVIRGDNLIYQGIEVKMSQRMIEELHELKGDK
ncbi:Vacuolar protein sorting-associated protein 13 [Conglomerata obtusa]